MNWRWAFLFFVVIFIPFIIASSENRYIVQVKESQIGDSLDNFSKETIKSPEDYRGIAKAELKLEKTSLMVISDISEEQLNSNKKIIKFEPDYKFSLLGEKGWNYAVIGINSSNMDNNTGQGIKVAVLDTGINYNLISAHPGYDFVNEDNDASDDNGHGTTVSYFLRNPEDDFPLKKVEIYPVKVLDENGAGYASDIIEGINWAIGNDMDIIIMSFGGDEDLSFLRDAIIEAYNNNIFLIGAVGNEESENILYPAKYDEVISVGSINENLQRSSFSNYGPELDFVAPGEDIFISDGLEEIELSGTSYSVPHTAIVAVSYLYTNKSLTNADLFQKMKQSALDLGNAGRDNEYGWGLVRYEKENNKAWFKGIIYDVEQNETNNLRKASVGTTIKITLESNKTVYLKSDNEGKFELEFEENITKVEVLQNNCTLFVDESKITSYRNISSMISIMDNKKCSQYSIKAVNNFAKYGLGPEYPNRILYYYDINPEKIPILFIHGWSNEANSDEGSWGELEEKFLDENYDVWKLQYWPANLSNRKNAGVISEAIGTILWIYDTNKLDVVSHSMGGLGTRGYIQNLSLDESGNKMRYYDDIRKYAIIASPMYGTYRANQINDIYDFPLICDVIDWLMPLNRVSEATKDMELGSDFTWELNSQQPNENIEYLTIGGFKSYPMCLYNNNQIDDGLVPMTSSNLLRYNIPHITLERIHTNYLLTVGIKENYQTGGIVDDFIKNRGTIAIKENLKYSGEYYIDPDDANADYSHYQNKGEVLVSFFNKDSITEVKLYKNPTLYTLTKNPRTKRWFYLNWIGFNQYSNELSVGTYDIYYNEGKGLKDSGQDVVIGYDAVSLITINNYPDFDNDGYDNQTDCNDNNAQIKPGALEKCNNVDDNCDNTIDEGYDKGAICSVGMGECKSVGVKICLVDGSTTVCNATAKIPKTEICGDGLDNDCDGLTDEGCDNLLILSPNKAIYNATSILLGLNSTYTFSKIEYVDNLDSGGKWTSLCTNCNYYSKAKTLKEGNNTLIFRGILPDGKNITNQTKLFVDSKKPQISTIKPVSMKYTNGSDFYIKYSEDNCKALKLIMNDVEVKSGSCKSGKNIEEAFTYNLSKYNSQSVNYKIKIIDIADNFVESRATKVKIDTLSPVIKDLKYPTSGKYVLFNMTILNENANSFGKVEYMDNGGRWTSLCTSLKNNVCYKKILLKTGTHSITIRVTDEAGNQDSKMISVNI